MYQIIKSQKKWIALIFEGNEFNKSTNTVFKNMKNNLEEKKIS